MVVLNLLNNSIDSLESFDGMRSIVISSFTENEKINLSVADSGVGVPIESQEKIFELFLTTKNDGMGFGLWLSQAVMENHRGSLFIDKDYPKALDLSCNFAFQIIQCNCCKQIYYQ